MAKRPLIILFFLLLFFYKPPVYARSEGSSKFRFAVLGCMHMGLCSPQEYESAVEKIREYRPDFVLFLGGMVDSIGDKPVESLWREFDRITAKLGVPVYNIPGNCRLLNLSVPADRMALMEKCFLNRYRKRYYSFEYKNSLFIGLDTESETLFDLENGLVIAEQLNFLTNALTNTSRYNNVFLFMHRSPWFQDNTEWFKTIHPLIKGKVKYVFGANRHILDAKESDDIKYITTGFPPCYQESLSTVLSFPHFLIVDVDKKQVSVNIVPVKPIPIKNLENTQKEDEIILFRDGFVPRFKPYILSTSERETILQPERVVRTLEIKPGMDIVDIGAGTGFFTFRFADALKGTGKVFATDVDQDMINYMKAKIEKGKYKNVFPVSIKPEGVDAFYKQHSFDIIFLSEVYQYLWNAQDYFQGLRPSLKKTGRLYIIHFKNDSDFSEVEFEDFRKAVNILRHEGEDFPVYKRLSAQVRNFVKDYRDGDIPPEIRSKIIRDFNKMLLDRWLLDELLNYYALKKRKEAVEYVWGKPLTSILYPLDVRLAKWLVVQLDENGVFGRTEKRLSDIDKRQLHQLNRILLMGIFQTEKLSFIKGIPPIYLEKNSIISAMETSGYEFVGEHDFLTQHCFLEFRRKF